MSLLEDFQDARLDIVSALKVEGEHVLVVTKAIEDTHLQFLRRLHRRHLALISKHHETHTSPWSNLADHAAVPIPTSQR